MRPLLALAAVSALLLASCGLESPPEWQGTPNPLDLPEAPPRAPADGVFGKFGNEYPVR